MADNGGGRLNGRMKIQFCQTITGLNSAYINSKWYGHKTQAIKCQAKIASEMLRGYLKEKTLKIEKGLDAKRQEK